MSHSETTTHPAATLGRPPRAPDLPSLTGLRFLAAAAVVFCHTTQVFGPGTVAFQYAGLGYIGVEFFFILSGLVLTWSHDPSVKRGTFYRRRFARIYPLYITTWIGVVVAAFILDMPGQSLIGAVLGIIMIQAFFPQQHIYQAGNTPGWSLSAEAFFYALFPFMVGRLPKCRWTTVVLVIAVMVGGIAYSVSPAYSVWFAYYSPMYGLLFFVIGMTLMPHVVHESTPIPSLRISLGIFVACFLAAGTIFADRPKGFIEALLLPAIVLLLVAAARDDLRGRKTLWSHPGMVKLGQWSFALYLVHWGMIGLLSKVIGGPLDSLASLGLGTALLAAATAVAALAYNLLERPCERWIRGGPRSEGVAKGRRH